MSHPNPSSNPTPSIPSLELFSLHGQNALITGGSRGIGAAIAIALAEAGAFICLAQRDPSNDSTINTIRSKGLKAESVSCDLANTENAKAVFQKALDVMGGQIHILVNCGGLLKRGASVDVCEADWDYLMDVNLKSLFLICQSAGRHMIPLQRGKIINIASLNSFIGGDQVAPYTASKGGVAQLTKALSNEWAKHNIQVNALAPGFIATDMNSDLRSSAEIFDQRANRTPAKRWGAPADFAGPAVFLASRASQYVCGEVLVVDGGVLCS
ncbi:NAD(P)-binding protein [Cadophora sp. DSE1049]|nr:NAD(P)-binding protein [Cadophora sp. DSE1049]